MAPTFNKGSSGKREVLHEKFLLGIQYPEMISLAIYTLNSGSKSSFNRDNYLSQIYISFECLELGFYLAFFFNVGFFVGLGLIALFICF